MNKLNKRLSAAVAVIAGFLIIGTFFYHHAEGWSYFDSFYVTGITLTTVGYGDLTPTHATSKLFSVFLAFAGVSLVFYSVSIMARHYFEREVENRVQTALRSTKQMIHDEERQVERALKAGKRRIQQWKKKGTLHAKL